ncbi:PREDICTED: PRUPE_7G169000 [Prunus dulcis]|uniref:PREDICTED: PRUPE_7G169000 n=1 Tax=Prunus dulcis TaxID=3755 RepID=A0A5E4E5B7_PRUDU|nr:PREDICTED: PRUPE_7G169000 [Prunus dulcis]
MGNCNSCLPQTPNPTELENPESRANPLPPFTAPHPADISTVPASASSQMILLVAAAAAARVLLNFYLINISYIYYILLIQHLVRSSSSAFDAGPSNTGGEDLDEKPFMVVADYGGIILKEGQQPNFHTFKEKDL